MTRNASSRKLTGRRSVMVVVMALSVMMGLATSCNAHDAGQMSAVLVNRERAAHGLGALGWDDQLAAKAQAWAQTMASQSAISHSNLTSGITESWTTLGENVGYGNDIKVVHDGFMRSPVHRDAILSTQYTSIGVGVAVRGNLVFVVQEFLG